MSKGTTLHDFRVVVRNAEFSNGIITVPYGSARDVFSEHLFQDTIKGAVAKLVEFSQAEARPHKASLTMRYREDVKARGIGKVPSHYFDGTTRFTQV